MKAYPVEDNSTEKLTCPHKEGIHSFFGRMQKVIEKCFLCCCQDTVDFVPLSSKPDYVCLESPETQSEDTTPCADVKCVSEQRIESLSIQDNWSHSDIPGCSYFVLPGEPIGDSDNLSLLKMSTNITTVDTTTVAEDSVKKKSSTKNLWKKTQSFFRRARKAMTRPLLCSSVVIVEPTVLLIESTESLCGDSTRMDGSSDLKSIPETMLPGEAGSGMEASFVETDSGETEIAFETGTFM